ncbi:hypothetical protein [uncultured Mucilaginibacter sp.]|uniref:hypothetical protein n=1 Tax=uncultured Mucilaginibacter sp. TaxID=797541 RepID=UPI0026141502|nr:hypothetical protein [uncultured Mucilaginibacter sp.]
MKKLLPFFIALLMVSACKKVQILPVTVPVKFTATTYQTLGNYDDAGKPLYLATSDVISSTNKLCLNIAFLILNRMIALRLIVFTR